MRFILWQRLQGADNRWLYPTDYRYAPTYIAPDGTLTNYRMNACVLTNTSRGHGWTFCLSAKATPVKDLQLSLSYTHTMLRQVNSMPGTNATSLWSTLPTVNGPNLADVQSGANVCPHRIIGTLSWHTGHHHLSLFYHGYRPGAYSYMYSNDLNGDGIVNDLLYIPRDDSEIRFATDADRQAFWQYVEQDDYLRSHKGSYAGAYAVHAPWVHKFDLHWSFEMGLRMGNIQHKLELLVDVDNITNFFNSRWGVTQVLANPRILTVKSVTNGVPTFTSTVAPGASSFVYSSNSAQCWKVCLGLRYHFN